jgi:hypothetical protein
MANEKRLIDAKGVAIAIKFVVKQIVVGSDWLNGYKEGLLAAVRVVEDIGEVDAVEVVHGYNIDRDTPSLFECSVCHWSCWDTYCGDTADYNYCPNCGAKMDGDGNGNQT